MRDCGLSLIRHPTRRSGISVFVLLHVFYLRGLRVAFLQPWFRKRNSFSTNIFALLHKCSNVFYKYKSIPRLQCQRWGETTCRRFCDARGIVSEDLARARCESVFVLHNASVTILQLFT